jgi:hypothetical protein
MKLLSIVQLGFTTLTMAVAAPLLDATLEPQEMSLEARDIVKRGLCTPTGPGNCNLGLQFYDPYIGKNRRDLPRDVYQPDLNTYIFDRYCNIIGQYDGMTAGVGMDSELPWVMVCVAVGGTVTSPTWDFHYSNEDINYVRDCSCSDCSNTYISTCCQCAFSC